MPARQDLESLETALEYTFTRSDLLHVALTHCSYPLKTGGGHNEKLEFLGDAVLGLAMSDFLILQYPHYREGELSKARAALVNARSLAAKAAALSLGEWLRLGTGEERSGGRDKPSILASAYEAVLGAVHTDGGYAAASDLIWRQFRRDIEGHPPFNRFDTKTSLQEIAQKVFKEIPEYIVVETSGPDHQRHFVSHVVIAGNVYGRGEGASKKRAHQAAALHTLELLQVADDGPEMMAAQLLRES